MSRGHLEIIAEGAVPDRKGVYEAEAGSCWESSTVVCKDREGNGAAVTGF